MGKEVDPFFHKVALMKQLIQERDHPLELLRKLISNAAAQEIGAKNIWITYYGWKEKLCLSWSLMRMP
jgi:hypothetical protein